MLPLAAASRNISLPACANHSRSRRVFTGMIPIFLVILAWPLPGQSSKLPDTAAGRALASILRFIDTGNAKGFQQYAAAAFTEEFLRGLPADRMAQNVTRIHETTGGLEIAEATAKPDGAVEVVARARRNPEFFAHFLLRLSPEGKISELRLGIKDPVKQHNPYASLPPETSLPGKIAAIDRELQAAAAEERFSGVLLITRNGDPLLERAVGSANRAFNVPNTLNTKFYIASQTKMFTAIAAMQLVAAGKLRLEEPIAKHLPDYPDQKSAARITLRQLLTHTSGLGDFQSAEYEAKRWQLKGLADFYQFFAHRPLRFEPGKGWGYSNAGFLLLGLIVERASGQPYTEYVQQRIFRPAGMTSSGFALPDDLTSNLAVGYTRVTKEGGREGPLRTSTLMVPHGSPAGGAHSTARDLLRFVNALQKHTLLDAEHSAMVIKAQAKPDGSPELHYGFGFRVLTINGQRVFGHGGSIPGGSSELFVFPDSGLVVIALANIDPPAASQMVTPIVELLAR